MSLPGTARAWGWVAHLRDGGTTPWLAWTGTAEPSARVLPGAQQLELVRRINLATSSDIHNRGYSHLSTRLADRVFSTAAAGRGKPDLTLLGVEGSTYGPRPVDPAAIAAHDLVRVATSVLAEDVVELGVPARRRRIPRLRAQRYRVAGDPIDADAIRTHLTDRGRRPGGPEPLILVLGRPLDQMLADVWTRRCFERGSGGWPEWLRFLSQRGELPPRIDLPAVVARHGGHATVVLDHRELPTLLGVRRLPPPRRPGADAAELARRIATVVGLLVPAPERAALMSQTLLPRMPAGAAPQVSLPEEHRDWVRVAAERMERNLRRAGYPVVGDPATVMPAGSAGSAPGSAAAGDLTEQVLALAVRMLVDETWKGRR